MNKTTKGSLAAGAAAVLLLGGAGSLAYWTGEASADAGSINSGFLTLNDGTCDEAFYYGTDPEAEGAEQVVNFVPGDVVSTQCDFIINAQGQNLEATPTVADSVSYTVGPESDVTPAGGSGATFLAEVSTSYTVNNVAFDPNDPITELDAGAQLVATIVVNIPFGTDNEGNGLDGLPAGESSDTITNADATQNITVNFGELAVSLAQNTNP